MVLLGYHRNGVCLKTESVKKTQFTRLTFDRYPLFNAFLPQYLQNAGKHVAPTPTNIVYRNFAITSIVGVPGSIIAWYTVDVKYIGRKGTIAISTLLTGIILFLFTISSKSNFQVAMSSLEAFFQNIMYGVLYA